MTSRKGKKCTTLLVGVFLGLLAKSVAAGIGWGYGEGGIGTGYRSRYYQNDFENEILEHEDEEKARVYGTDPSQAEARFLETNITGNVIKGLTLFEAPNGALAFIINNSLAVRDRTISWRKSI